MLKASPRLRDTAERLVTTQTQALQLWFRPDLRGLGWPGPKPIVGAYALWLDTWADLSHLLAREDWPAAMARVRAVTRPGMQAIHLVEPSPQRTPVLYQAGSSPRGRAADRQRRAPTTRARRTWPTTTCASSRTARSR